jgi:segregation and condensation protein B
MIENEIDNLEEELTLESPPLVAAAEDHIAEPGADDEEIDEDLATPIPAADLRLETKIEAILFASQKPMQPAELLEVLQDPTVSATDVEETLKHLVEFYSVRGGGFRLHYIKRQGFQFRTSPATGKLMERMFASRPKPLTRAAQETLAIIAYRQPVTRAEIEFIRGVDAGSILKNLLERDLVKCVGRKEIAGRPMLFGTTDEFLKVFQLGNVKDLPPLEAFQPESEQIRVALEKIENAEAEIDLESYVGDVPGAEATTQ